MSTRNSPDQSGTRKLSLERLDYTLHSVMDSISPGKGHWEHLRLAPGLFASSVNAPASFKDEVRPFESGYIEFQLRFDGTIRRPTDETGANHILVPGASLLIYRMPHGRTTSNIMVEGERNAHASIFCTPEFLEQKFGQFRATLRPAYAAALGADATVPLALRISMYPRLTRLAHELARSHFTTQRRLVHAEGQILVLLAEMLAILETAQEDAALPQRLSDRDFDKIHKIRAYLVQSPTPFPSLKQLAKQSGLGETKLKSGFKALFGQSIFAFAHDLRMRHARDLLRRNELSIAQVAESVGYEYQNSFTVAFRKHFGVLPRAYRRNPIDIDEADVMSRLAQADNGEDPDNVFGVSPSRHTDD